MKYEKLLAAGRGMSEAEIADSIKGLANDPRFAAVIGAIDRIKEQIADTSCVPQYANQHGTLEHAQGCRYGLKLLEGRIRNVTDAGRKSGERAPE